MKHTEEKILLLKVYYETRRGVGHTSALVNGIANTDPIVLGRDLDDLRNTSRMAGKVLYPSVSWVTFPKGMYGQNRPLVVTETALVQILGEVLEELKQSRAENYILKEMLRAAYNWRNDEE